MYLIDRQKFTQSVWHATKSSIEAKDPDEQLNHYIQTSYPSTVRTPISVSQTSDHSEVVSGREWLLKMKHAHERLDLLIGRINTK